MTFLVNFFGSVFGGFYDSVPLDRDNVQIFLLLMLIVFGALIIFACVVICQDPKKPDYRAVAACVIVEIVLGFLLYLNTPDVKT